MFNELIIKHEVDMNGILWISIQISFFSLRYSACVSSTHEYSSRECITRNEIESSCDTWHMELTKYDDAKKGKCVKM